VAATSLYVMPCVPYLDRYIFTWCVRLTTYPPSCALVMKSGNFNFLEPSGTLQACNRTVLPFLHLHVQKIALLLHIHEIQCSKFLWRQAILTNIFRDFHSPSTLVCGSTMDAHDARRHHAGETRGFRLGTEKRHVDTQHIR
jgi:hypothetical protein